MNKRPTIITILCIIGFIGAAFAIPIVFSPLAKQIAPWYPPYVGAGVLIGVIALIGLWKMKRWGIYLYTGYFFITSIVLIASGLWSMTSAIVPLLVIIIGFSQYKKMT